jgi:dTDP-4-amino-4,6-dideoxygalactose transaminase
MSRIYLSAPDIRGDERAMVDAAITSNWVAPIGPDLDAFEHEIAAVTGVLRAVGLSSGTAALHLALLELGIGAGDIVLVSTHTFVASANSVAYTGATPVFVDSDATTWQLSPDLVEEELEQRAVLGTLPKAAIVVDLYGQCADYARLIPLFDRYGVAVIEDAAESLGASYRKNRAGSFGSCGVVSFNGNKIITTSGGGMLLCHDDELAARARHLSTQGREDAPHYEHAEVGFNYRLSNVLAALGRAQLATLPDRIERRRQINQRYRATLSELPGLDFMPVAPYGEPNWWLTCITVEPDAAGYSTTDLRIALEAADIEARPTWKPMHLQPLFADAPARVDGTSQRLFETGLCLPSGSGMTDDELDRVIAELLHRAEGS